jgi:molybdenum cofactor cytidylyltransferase
VGGLIGVTAARLDALVLAAGAGVRFGGGKLKAPWRGRPLIEGALAAAFASPARSVFLVTGADGEIAPLAQAFAAARREEARLVEVHAADHARGMSASLRAGLAALPEDTEAAFVFLGDMPSIPHDAPGRLATALTLGYLAAAPLFEGARGHPVLIRRDIFRTLGDLTGDQGARRTLDQLGAGLALVPVHDSGVLYDVDAPEDLE